MEKIKKMFKLKMVVLVVEKGEMMIVMNELK